MAIPPRPIGPIFPAPPPAASPTTPAPGTTTPGAVVGRQFAPGDQAPNFSAYYAEGTPRTPPANYSWKKPAFDWSGYADGSWLGQQFPQGSFLQRLVGLIGGTPQTPTGTTPAGRDEMRIQPFPNPGLQPGGEFPLLQLLSAKSSSPSLAALPPRFTLDV